jgi:hypothetical protein
MSYARLWKFVADMNSDGSVTISDVWLWFKWLYFYPGDGLLHLLMKGFPDITDFFEITEFNYGGLLSGIISFVIWLCLLISPFAIREDYQAERLENN